MFGKDCGHAAGVHSFVCPSCDDILRQMKDQEQAKVDRQMQLLMRGVR